MVLRIFFDEPDEIEIEPVVEIPTEEEADEVISEYQSPLGNSVYFPDTAHESLVETLTTF